MLSLEDKRDLAALSDCFDVSYGATSLIFAMPPPLNGLDRRCELWKDFAGPENKRGDL